MKYRSFSILLVVIMLVISSGSALAQGTTPPAGSDDPKLLQEDSFWFPNWQVLTSFIFCFAFASRRGVKTKNHYANQLCSK